MQNLKSTNQVSALSVGVMQSVCATRFNPYVDAMQSVCAMRCNPCLGAMQSMCVARSVSLMIFAFIVATICQFPAACWCSWCDNPSCSWWDNPWCSRCVKPRCSWCKCSRSVRDEIRSRVRSDAIRSRFAVASQSMCNAIHR